MRLANLSLDGLLTQVSAGAYDSGLVGLVKVGPFGDLPWVSKLVRVQVADLRERDHSAVLALRWEATGPGGHLFPALDADITLAPAGEGKSSLTLDGAYRAPLAALGSGLDKVILNRVATATIQSLLDRIADAICAPADRAAGD